MPCHVLYAMNDYSLDDDNFSDLSTHSTTKLIWKKEKTKQNQQQNIIPYSLCMSLFILGNFGWLSQHYENRDEKSYKQ